MLSLLTRQVALLGEPEFLVHHGHAWLVWEPGALAPPRTPHEADLGATRLPVAAPPTGPRGSDALCFELIARASPTVLPVGRSPESAIVLDDMTVSRDQCRLVFSDDAWTVELYDGQPATSALTDGAVVHAGALTLTFQTAGGLVRRLRGPPAHEHR
jgi:hypothetical protein